MPSPSERHTHSGSKSGLRDWLLPFGRRTKSSDMQGNTDERAGMIDPFYPGATGPSGTNASSSQPHLSGAGNGGYPSSYPPSTNGRPEPLILDIHPGAFVTTSPSASPVTPTKENAGGLSVDTGARLGSNSRSHERLPSNHFSNNTHTDHQQTHPSKQQATRQETIRQSDYTSPPHPYNQYQTPYTTDSQTTQATQTRQDTLRPPIPRKPTHPQPTVRITLKAHLAKGQYQAQSFYFEPLVFELSPTLPGSIGISGGNGQTMTLCRSERSTLHSASLDIAGGKICFASRVVTRGCHCLIWVEDGERVFIQDMGSSAGTWINDIRLEENPGTVSKLCEVNEGDLIRLGQDYAEADQTHSSFKSVKMRISIQSIASSNVVSFRCKPNCHCTWRTLFDRMHIYPLSRPVEDARVVYEALRTWMDDGVFGEGTTPGLGVNAGARKTAGLPSGGGWVWEKGERKQVGERAGERGEKKRGTSGDLGAEASSGSGWNVESLSDWEVEDARILIDVLEQIIIHLARSSAKSPTSAFIASPPTPSTPTMTPQALEADSSLLKSYIRKVSRKTGVLPTSFVLTGVTKNRPDAVAGGGFADIYRGTYGGREIAIKVVRTFITEENRKKIQRDVANEALFWKHLNHPHILPFLGVTKELFAPRLGLVCPWMANGNILQYLERHPEKDRLSLLAQSAHGLKYLHHQTQPLVHGDCKAANILIDDDGRVRLTDFGLISISETQDFRTTLMPGERGSTRWMAPELFQSGVKKSRRSDVYAFGMTILEIYTGHPPFSNGQFNNDLQVLMAVSGGARPERPGSQLLQCMLPDELWELAERCWHNDPANRPTSTQLAEELDYHIARLLDVPTVDIPLENLDLDPQQRRQHHPNPHHPPRLQLQPPHPYPQFQSPSQEETEVRIPWPMPDFSFGSSTATLHHHHNPNCDRDPLSPSPNRSPIPDFRRLPS